MPFCNRARMRGGFAMSNRQDNSPSLDYFELRRRHEEYKNRERLASKERQAKPAQPAQPPVRPTAEAAAPMGAAMSEETPMPTRMVTMGVTRMSTLVSLLTSLPHSEAMMAMA